LLSIEKQPPKDKAITIVVIFFIIII